MPGASRARAALLARLAVDDEDDKKDDKSRDAAKRLEDQARDLIEKLSKEFGPAGEELRKVLERAVGEVHKSLEKENPSPDDLRSAGKVAGGSTPGARAGRPDRQRAA